MMQYNKRFIIFISTCTLIVFCFLCYKNKAIKNGRDSSEITDSLVIDTQLKSIKIESLYNEIDSHLTIINTFYKKTKEDSLKYGIKNIEIDSLKRKLQSAQSFIEILLKENADLNKKIFGLEYNNNPIIMKDTVQ